GRPGQRRAPRDDVLRPLLTTDRTRQRAADRPGPRRLPPGSGPGPAALPTRRGPHRDARPRPFPARSPATAPARGHARPSTHAERFPSLMRVLSTVTGSQGHARAVLPLVRALAAAGHEVVVALPPHLAEVYADSGARVEAV